MEEVSAPSTTTTPARVTLPAGSLVAGETSEATVAAMHVECGAAKDAKHQRFLAGWSMSATLGVSASEGEHLVTTRTCTEVQVVAPQQKNRDAANNAAETADASERGGRDARFTCAPGPVSKPAPLVGGDADAFVGVGASCPTGTALSGWHTVKTGRKEW